MDSIFQFNVVKLAESLKTKLAGYESTYKKQFNAHLLVEVDWSWTSNVNFRKERVETQREMCNALVSSHLYNLFLSSNDDRFVSFDTPISFSG